MRIAHLCLSNWYVEGVYYQENQLIRQHVLEGHDVIVIASTEIQKNGLPDYVKPQSFIGSEGAFVVRLGYRCWPAKLARKLRIHSGVYDLLARFRPDSILFHGTCGWEIATAARYAQENPQVLFYIDSHEDRYNSARNVLSREILHKLYYRYCLSRAWPVARKILCVSTETMDFVEDVYRVPRNRLEFYPLGGRPVQMSEYADRRRRTRGAMGVSDDQLLFVQSGKQTVRKKLLETLAAFKGHAPANARLIVVGVLAEDIREAAMRLIAENPQVEYGGWKEPEALTDLLCAADVYLQPGTQSVTMQHSLCCHCAVILDDAPSHKVYVNGNGWLLNESMTLGCAIAEAGKADLAAMQEKSFRIAAAMLDYAELGKRVLRP